MDKDEDYNDYVDKENKNKRVDYHIQVTTILIKVFGNSIKLQIFLRTKVYVKDKHPIKDTRIILNINMNIAVTWSVV